MKNSLREADIRVSFECVPAPYACTAARHKPTPVITGFLWGVFAESIVTGPGPHSQTCHSRFKRNIPWVSGRQEH